jgi:CheY-like chemotaxis protein
VWLPLRAPNEVLLLEARVAKSVAGPGPRTALVVESDPKSAQLIRLQLEAEGFTVVHAASGEAALAVAETQPLSLITLDILLPEMDGWSLLGKLKQVPASSRVPVVIISILADRNKGFALGAAAIMQKPISRSELAEVLGILGVIPRGPGKALRVLVADDDPKAVELIAVHLASMGNAVLRAYGGSEAIALARREAPDLIVLDLMMPETSGFDVIEALREPPTMARIPIIVLTAKQVTAKDRVRLNDSVSAILEKTGFDHERFAAAIRRTMSAPWVEV